MDSNAHARTEPKSTYALWWTNWGISTPIAYKQFVFFYGQLNIIPWEIYSCCWLKYWLCVSNRSERRHKASPDTAGAWAAVRTSHHTEGAILKPHHRFQLRFACSFRPSGAPVAPLPPGASAVGLGCGSVMAVHRGPSTKWLFTREQLENTPSRRCGIEADRELSYRQQAANLIQDIGQRLNVYPFWDADGRASPHLALAYRLIVMIRLVTDNCVAL